MFDKVKFAHIIKNIKEKYHSQEDFSKKSGIGRTYISQYMNMKIEEPPKPKTLEKLADASRGLTSYHELMEICGYIGDDYFLKLNELNEKQGNMRSYYLDKLVSFKLSEQEEQIYHDLINIIPTSKFSRYSDIQINKELNDYFNNMDYLSDKSKTLIQDKIKIFIKYFSEMNKISKDISSLETTHSPLYAKANNNMLLIDKIINNEMCNIPIFGKIAAGEPILAEQYIEGYLPIDPNIYGLATSDDLFYLKVYGDSMNQKVENGDYVLIHKQDYAEDGDIVVAIVNDDDEATLKRYKVINEQFIQLEPMSNNPEHETRTIDLKTTKFILIGKAIGKFGKF